MGPTEAERFTAAARRFRAFFEELATAFMEREDVLHQLALALLAKEHVLLTGPPGTAKSQLASAVLGRIVCETSGAPSLFARQITESTVQTDLIGPIDFKNLTETGRTTHFTDEGMLGAAHAFLDEVFDGRDMLLRSALNVLQERELKQGNVITRGRIECALMTSNRYIAEVLEESRDTLLAFVDRIAFIGFVPRGFSTADELKKILRHRMAAGGKLALDGLLTIQDLDVLQAAAERVYVAPELCDAVAELLTTFDAEIAAASRADPAFLPTRYVSTRTAVRGVALLRAICLLQKVFHAPGRALAASASDLPWLRLHLLLSGPTPKQAAALLEREVDPTERRQLTLLVKEREIFDGCVARVRVADLTPQRQPAPAARPSSPAPSKRSAARPAAPVADPLRVLEDRVAGAIASGATRELVALLAEIGPRTRDGEPDRERAQALLRRASAGIAAEGLRAIVRLPLPDQALVDTVRGVVDVATSLDDGSASMHKTARWMHEQALLLLEQASLFATGLNAAAVAEVDHDGAYSPDARTTRTLRALREIVDLRAKLLAQSASQSLHASDPSWDLAMGRVEEDLAALWSRGFSDLATEFASGRGLGSLLGALAPQLERLDKVGADIAAVTGRPSRLKQIVVGPRVLTLVERALAEVDLTDRARLLREVTELSAALAKHGLPDAIGLPGWLGVVATALERAEAHALADRAHPLDASGYRALRASEQRTPIGCTLVEIALSLDPLAAASPTPAGDIPLPQLLEVLAPPLRARVVELDLARIRRGVDFLDRWWRSIAPASAEAPTPAERERIRASKFLEVVWEEAALARFALETRLLEQILAEQAEPLAALRARIEALYAAVRGAGLGLVEERARAAWARAQART